MHTRSLASLAYVIPFTAFTLLAGCSGHNNGPSPSSAVAPSGRAGGVIAPEQVQTETQLFLSQKPFDPWLLTNADANRAVDVYLPGRGIGQLIGPDGAMKTRVFAGEYKNGVIAAKSAAAAARPSAAGYRQTLDLLHGTVTTQAGKAPASLNSSVGGSDWAGFWKRSDIAIEGDPEAQQAVHACMFYLAGSAAAGGNSSIPPMGFSSIVYQGHIFWDAEIWMFPALVAQHPDLARGIIEYRYKRLAQAEKLAATHGYKGAEYPWESADTGKEEAPAEFAKERHITADIAYAAWQYYLWTGDRQYLASTAWPILKANADYWVSRASKGPGADGKYHITGVVGPDETSGLVDDDAWTNAVVAETLREASLAAKTLGQSASPQWSTVASNMTLLFDKTRGIYLEHARASDILMAKQADTQMLIYPLHVPMSADTAGKTLDYYSKHTMSVGPAMTDSVNALIAARLGRVPQSLDLFHASYRPFMRGPWDAFSEKRTKDNVYFCTGMGGCLQAVLYGFAGLNVAGPGQTGQGKLIARAGDASLHADPHLPPGWTGLTIKGIQFRGGVYDLTVGQGNTVSVAKR